MGLALYDFIQAQRAWSLIRPLATFSHQEGREKAIVVQAFSRFFQREKVPEGWMRG
jgi:hypothetical protein